MKNMIKVMKQTILFLLLWAICVPMSANWPQDGMKAHWDFTKKFDKDLLHGTALYSENTKTDREEYKYVKRQLKNGKMAILSKVTLPYMISELDSFTVILKFYVEYKDFFEVIDSVKKEATLNFDRDILDGEVVKFHSKCVLEGKDDKLVFSGYANDSTVHYSNTEMKIVTDENDEFVVVLSYKKPTPDSQPFKKRNILFGCGMNGMMKYYYTNFIKKNIHFLSFETYHDNDKIEINTPVGSEANLVEVVLYDRLFSPAELAEVMGTETVNVYQPEEDASDWKDWRYCAYALLIPLVLYRILKVKRPKKYRPITARYIRERFGEQVVTPEKREEALGYISELWTEFGDRKKPVYPKDSVKVRALFESALATGCTDKDVLKEYNSLAALINEGTKIALQPYAGFAGAIAVFLIASAGAFFNKQWVYEVQSYGFIVNWVAMFFCLFASLRVMEGIPGERIKNARLLMGSMRFMGQAFGTAMVSVAIVAVAAFFVVVGAVLFILNSILASIVTVTWVSVSTGRVVGTSVSGGWTGLILAGVVIYVVVWLLSLVWPFAEWILVLIAPFVVFNYTMSQQEEDKAAIIVKSQY